MAIGCFTPLIAQYLSAIGFDGTQIGAVTATGTLVAIFAVAFWGRIYNRASAKAGVIELLCLGAIIFNAALMFTDAMVPVIIMFGIMYFFQAPIMSLVDSYTVLGQYDNFGGKRAWGAVGFAAGVFIAGRLADLISLRTIFGLYETCFAVTIVVLIVLHRRLHGNPSARPEIAVDKSRKYADLLKSRRVVEIIICAFFMGGTNVANNTYFSFLYIEGGGTIAGVGVCMLLMVGSEVPFMAWSRRLSDRFTMEKVLLAAMIVSVMRFCLYGIGLPWWVLIIMFFTQGAVNGIILVEFVRCAAACAPEGCSSLAISAYYIIGSNISTVVCQFAGGIILDSFGATGVYMFFGLFNLAGVLLYFAFGLFKSK
ncbi:MAG: MFS transporter [Clostridia bacterium]|nr:MFS transporter [Clostridia bacterium]